MGFFILLKHCNPNPTNIEYSTTIGIFNTTVGWWGVGIRGSRGVEMRGFGIEVSRFRVYLDPESMQNDGLYGSY